MRVLLVCEYATLNGGEHSMLSVLPLLQAAGIEFSVAAPESGELSERLKELNVQLTPYGASNRQDLDRKRKVGQLCAAVAEYRPDLVHANSLSMSRIVGHARASLRTCTLGHVRDIIKLSDAAIRDVAQNERIVAVSQATKSHFVAQGIPDSKIEVIYNGIDVSLFRPRAASKRIHQELALPDDTRFVLIVGQLGLRKGVDDALRAVSLIAPEFRNVHILVVGERHSQKDEALEYERHLHALAATPELAGRVHFLGRRSDVHVLMNESQILLHLAKQEPLGRVLLEAAASGCCVLASNVGGTSEIFPPSYFPESLVSRSDPQQAAHALRVLLVDSLKRIETAARMSERIRTHFPRKRSADSIAKLYRDTLGR